MQNLLEEEVASCTRAMASQQASHEQLVAEMRIAHTARCAQIESERDEAIRTRQRAVVAAPLVGSSPEKLCALDRVKSDYTTLDAYARAAEQKLVRHERAKILALQVLALCQKQHSDRNEVLGMLDRVHNLLS